MNKADSLARLTHHLDHAPHLAEWPPDVAGIQARLAEVTDELEVADEGQLEDLARRERELLSKLEAAKTAAMSAPAGANGAAT